LLIVHIICTESNKYIFYSMQNVRYGEKLTLTVRFQKCPFEQLQIATVFNIPQS